MTNEGSLTGFRVLDEARSSLALEGGDIAGKRVVVVEDGPTLTHGGMTFGAGVVAARRFGAAEIVDPRPYAAGELAGTLATVADDAQRHGARAHEADIATGAGRNPGRRQVSSGSSASTVPMPAITASWRPRIACPARRARACTP